MGGGGPLSGGSGKLFRQAEHLVRDDAAAACLPPGFVADRWLSRSTRWPGRPAGTHGDRRIYLHERKWELMRSHEQLEACLRHGTLHLDVKLRRWRDPCIVCLAALTQAYTRRWTATVWPVHNILRALLIPARPPARPLV